MSVEKVPAESPEGSPSEQPDQENPATMPLEQLADLIRQVDRETRVQDIEGEEATENEPEPETDPEPESEPAKEPEPDRSVSEPTDSSLKELQSKLERDQWQARYMLSLIAGSKKYSYHL